MKLNQKYLKNVLELRNSCTDLYLLTSCLVFFSLGKIFRVNISALVSQIQNQKYKKAVNLQLSVCKDLKIHLLLKYFFERGIRSFCVYWWVVSAVPLARMMLNDFNSVKGFVQRILNWTAQPASHHPLSIFGCWRVEHTGSNTKQFRCTACYCVPFTY